MRSELFLRLNDFGFAYNMQPSTYFLGCHLVDRVLTISTIKGSKLLLLGLTCLLIAAKLEERDVPSTEHWGVGSVGSDELVHTERTVLGILEFDFSVR